MAPERRSLITSEPSLSAEEVTHRTFATTFRGLDPGEVRSFLDRVANELRNLRERNQELDRLLRDAESRAAHPELDEGTLMTALGEETARIVRSAHEAATDIKAKAEENAQRILREGHEEATRLRGEADRVLTVRTEEADAAAASIREAAESWGDAVRNRASEEAQQVIEAARAEGRRMIEEAQAVRAKVLGDLSRRRRIAAVQVEQLRAGRERLLESYRLVRNTLDEVTEDLQRAEAEARSAANAAASRAEAEVDDVTPEEIDAALRSVRELDASLGLGEVAASAPAPGPDDATDAGDELAPTSTSVGAGEVAEAPTEPTVAIDADRADAPGTARGATEERRGSSLRILRRPKSDEPKAAPPKPSISPTTESESVRIIRPAPKPDDGAAAASPPGTEPAAVTATEGESVEADEAAVAAAVAAAVEAPAVDELFARIRADREQAVADAEEVLADNGKTPAEALDAKPNAADGDDGGDGGDGGVAAGDATPPDGGPVSDADEALLQARDAALEGIEQQLTRKLKRALQDDQNDLLDRLRKRGKSTFVSLLPETDEQSQRFREVGRGLLEDAAMAGVGFAGEGADVSTDVGVGDLTDELASALVGPLRSKIEQALQATDDEGEDESVAVERVGMAYREWKAQRIERLAGDQVIAAFTRGTFLATPEGGTMRWVVSDLDGPCPDCDDNGLAGPTVRGEAFPTGQPHPPAHAGCRCLLAPAPR